MGQEALSIRTSKSIRLARRGRKGIRGRGPAATLAISALGYCSLPDLLSSKESISTVVGIAASNSSNLGVVDDTIWPVNQTFFNRVDCSKRRIAWSLSMAESLFDPSVMEAIFVQAVAPYVIRREAVS